MPSFHFSVDEFLSGCSTSERKEIIVAMVEDGFLPSWVIRPDGKVVKESDVIRTHMEEDYRDKMDLLKNKYYSLSSEDEETIKKLFLRYL